MRASYAVYKSKAYNFISQKTLLETFDTLIKPILLFSTEVSADEMKHENPAQSVLIQFCEHILGVHRKSLNIAVMSELRTYPLNIDSKQAMITYCLYLRDHDNEILSGTISEMQIMESNWVKMVEKIYHKR